MRSLPLLIALAARIKADPTVFDPSPYTKWVATSSDGLSRKAVVDIPFTNSSGLPDHVNYLRLDLVGDTYHRGFAQGELLSDEIVDLVDVQLELWYSNAIKGVVDSLDRLPEWVKTAIEAKVDAVAGQLFTVALQAVWDHESYAVPPRLIVEMDAIAAGVCAAIEAKVPDSCDVDEWKYKLYRINMIPELIEMTCTMFGAWGPASASGNLLQLRALDFGATPLSNFNALLVHRPAPGTASTFPSADGIWASNSTLPQAFASLAFPGLTGVITGVSEDGIALSEKVWEVSNMTKGVQAGRYNGEADVLVMRDVLELAADRATAEVYMRNLVRTFAVFLGVGDYATQQMDIVGYRMTDFHAYTPETMPAVTGQPAFVDLVYVDKHPQPSTADPADPNGMPALLAQYYGEIDGLAAMDIVAGHDTGDLHVTVYDFGDAGDKAATNKLWFSLGVVDANFQFALNEWKACHRPFVEYNLANLWAGL
jgi:hypothetical protein